MDSPHMQPLEQVGALAQLRQGLDDEDDVGAARDIAVLLRNMRRRPDVTYQRVKEIDTCSRRSTRLRPLCRTVPRPAEISTASGRKNRRRHRIWLIRSRQEMSFLNLSCLNRAAVDPVHRRYFARNLDTFSLWRFVPISESGRSNLWRRGHRPQEKIGVTSLLFSLAFSALSIAFPPVF